MFVDCIHYDLGNFSQNYFEKLLRKDTFFLMLFLYFGEENIEDSIDSEFFGGWLFIGLVFEDVFV